MNSVKIAFIGGGNMARAMIEGLLRSGQPPHLIQVVEPSADQRASLERIGIISILPQASDALADAQTVVWAVKPQNFSEAAATAAPFVRNALQVSVMAGIRTDTLARHLHTSRIVRSMPNTPALIGQGIAGLFATQAVTPDEHAQVEQLLSSTGEIVWFPHESDLDAVTALSGSGPAYVFFVIESLVDAAQAMGLSEEAGLKLALATFKGATALAMSASESPRELRQKVTSKGGTTHAAISHLEDQKVRESFVQALLAARNRAREMGEEFGTK